MGERYSLSASIYGAVFVEESYGFRMVVNSRKEEDSEYTDIWYEKMQ